MGYDYKKCTEDISDITCRYPFVEQAVIGYSVMKKPIQCLRAGRGKLKIFINCAHHGLEYITSAFIMKFLYEYAGCIQENKTMLGYNVWEFYDLVSMYVVPMVNPDGVDIAVNGVDITNPYHQKLISMVGIHSFNRVWQANAAGVDINHNYDAGWRVVKTRPSPTKFSGPYAESEPETKAVVDFVRKNNFDMLIAFHSQGGEIYYDFDGMAAENSRRIGEKMSESSGYPMCVPEGSASFGGCKDWFIKEFGKAGFTVEIGHGRNPLELNQMEDIYEKNSRLILSAMEELI
ncbi:MAG: M14 family metallocarboxypeptidase [Firmicutes bacterium]|nr:M14 family metallocarboxypeptidase [Bacillota bacterium]